MKRALFFFALFLFSEFIISQSPAFAWAKSIGGVGDEFSHDATTDAQGNVYIAGAFSGAVDFDPGPNVVTQYAVLLRDAFIAKYTSDGELVWVKTFGGNYHDGASCVITDQEGNVYVGGSFLNTVDFDPGTNVFNLTAAGSVNTPDIFLVKLTSNGDFVHAFRLGSDGYDNARELALDADGNVHVTGLFYDTVNFGMVNGSPVNLTSTGNNDVFVCKFNPNFELLWAKSFGSIASDSESAVSFVLDQSGNVFINGSFPFSVDFDPGPGVEEITSDGDDINSDIFILKLDASGNFVWVKTIGSYGPDSGYGIDLDGDENIYVTGLFTNTVDFDPGAGVVNLATNPSWTPFVLKLDHDGNFLWARSFLTDDAGIGQGIDADAQGNVYTTGFFRSTMDFDPGSNTFELDAGEEANVFMSKLSSNGDFVWAKSVGGLNGDQGNQIVVSDNSIYTFGEFDVAGNFNSDPSGTFQLTSNGFSDVFIHKMIEGPVSTEEVDALNIGVVAYPNPVHDVLNIQLPSNFVTDYYEIIGVTGCLVLEGYLNTHISICINTGFLMSGVFYLKLFLQNGDVAFYRFVKD